LSAASAQYAAGIHVVIDCDGDSGFPAFGEIVLFACSPSDDWHIVVRRLHTERFCSHYHAFAINMIDPAVH
jgi:hypothetical protein